MWVKSNRNNFGFAIVYRNVFFKGTKSMVLSTFRGTSPKIMIFFTSKLRNSASIDAYILCRHSLDDLVEAEQSLREKSL